MYAHLSQDKRPKKRSRDSEIALIESISNSLDTYIDENPTLITTSSYSSTSPYKKKRYSPTDASQNAAKNFLAAKTLIKSIAKARAQEDTGSNNNDDPLMDALVAEYKHKYPTLTKKLLVDGIVKYNITQNGAGIEGDATGGDGNSTADGDRLQRVIAAVNVDMTLYHDKIDALKKSRAASNPTTTTTTNIATTHPIKKRNGRPRKSKKEDTPENNLFDEIVHRYSEARGKNDNRAPQGFLEAMVDQTKRDMSLEHVDLGPMNLVDKRVRREYNRLLANDEITPCQPSQNRLIEEEIYARYERTKMTNGGKLPPGTIDTIIKGVALENAISPEVNMASLTAKVQARFTKAHPELVTDGGSGIGKLSAEQKKRRQTLLNEVTARYVKEKGSAVKKLPDGTLDKIIEQTKSDLGIYEVSTLTASVFNHCSFNVAHSNTHHSSYHFEIV